MRNLEERIMAKTRSANNVGASSTAAAAAGGARGGSDMDNFEQRILAKSMSGRESNASGSASYKRSDSQDDMNKFEQRILAKSMSGRGSNASSNADGGRGYKRSDSQDDMNKFEQRILAKSMSGRGSNGNNTGMNDSINSFEQRILAKSMNASGGGKSFAERRRRSEDSNGSSNSNSSSYSAKLEARIMEKSRSANNGNGSSRRDGAATDMNNFEQRILAKSMSNASGSASYKRSDSQDEMNNFEKRILAKSISSNHAAMGGGSNDLNSSARSINSGGTEGSFENRLRNKLSSSRTGMNSSQVLSNSSRLMNEEDEDDVEVTSDLQSRKRQAIKRIMQDETLSPQERNARLQNAMRGDWADDDIERQESGRQESDLSQSDDANRFRRVALEAKIASKLKNKAKKKKQEKENTAALEEGSWEGDEDEGAHVRGSKFAVRNKDLQGHHNDGDDSDEDSSRRMGLFADEEDQRSREGVGYGSLPLPEEHFVSDRDDPFSDHRSPTVTQEDEEQLHHGGQTISDPNDANFGLAVASAVAPDDEPNYVYNAIEYDPDAKPPLHLNRRFRLYTYMALFLIAVVVLLMVVYFTGLSKKDDVTNISIYFQDSPTIAPTPPPTTDREASGVIEQLEGGVLVRNETFKTMEKGDPRLLALDWILHIDMMQLVSDDINLYQRFALAVLAYSMDSTVWYVCGNPGENYTESECTITFRDNSTASFGTWLSSISECDWYGVTCSADGVVRGVDLNNNDLIGTLPHEIYALAFLQLLHLPNNCIYGTIPPEIGLMRHLMSLELHGNGLSGEMPDSIYDLEKLQLLNLADQWGSPRKCTNSDGRTVNINYRMGGLTLPLLENAGLSGKLGPKIDVWRSMKGLYLNKNSFDGSISDAIGNLRYLRFLWLHDNFVEGSIPESITKLGNLQELRLGENFLYSRFPQELGRLDGLERLEVQGNSMFGDIPQGLYKMADLEVLRLDDTLMADSPWLVSSDEGFTGSISTFIGGLQKLKLLLLNNNPITGTIPTELGLCKDLQVFRVHRTQISGTMPLEVCKLRDKMLNDADGSTGVLYADCRPNDRYGDPFLKCDCCSDCCDHTTGVCIADD